MTDDQILERIIGIGMVLVGAVILGGHAAAYLWFDVIKRRTISGK